MRCACRNGSGDLMDLSRPGGDAGLCKLQRPTPDARIVRSAACLHVRSRRAGREPKRRPAAAAGGASVISSLLLRTCKLTETIEARRSEPKTDNNRQTHLTAVCLCLERSHVIALQQKTAAPPCVVQELQ